jgi:hypothetical protein
LWGGGFSYKTATAAHAGAAFNPNGKEMIVWGGSDDYESEGTHGFPRSFLNMGAAYDPGSDTWRALEPSPLDPRGWHSAVWTGEEMIVWGGVGSSDYAGDAGAYDPDTDGWRAIP